MKRLITYLIVIALTFYTAVLYGSTSFLMLFYVELAPAVLSDAYSPAGNAQSETYNGAADSRGRAGTEGAGITAGAQRKLSNRRKDCGAGERNAADGTENRENFPKSENFEPGAGGGFIKTEYHARCVGNIHMEIGKVWCYDFLGLVAVPLSAKYWKALKPETMLVLPRICEVPVMVSRQSRDFAGESEDYSKERGGDDPSEVFKIRDYQPGDKLRSIHWKLTAKTDEMMVREQSLPLGCPVDFYLDLYQPAGHHGRKHETKRDSYLQIIASISHSLVLEGCRHHVIWFDSQRNDICRYRIEKEENIYEMLFRLGQLPVYHSRKELTELYRQKYHEMPGITTLELDTELVLKLNGETQARYSGDVSDIERQLGAKKLVV